MTMDGDNFIGTRISNYRIVAEINSGPFSSTYKAEDTQSKKSLVIIKVLNTYLGPVQERSQFVQEAFPLTMLEHPNLLPVVDFGFNKRFDERQPYLVTEYVTGGSLRDL